MMFVCGYIVDANPTSFVLKPPNKQKKSSSSN